MKQLLVLGIETSCDDTSVCILRGNTQTVEQYAQNQPIPMPEVLGLRLFSQDTIFKAWGGVVPEIAARNHLDKLAPLLQELFASLKLKPSDLDLIAVTTHPGLLGPLFTGLSAAKTLALTQQLPIVPVNHLFAHLEAIHLTESVPYPYLGLVVSGGHSLFMAVRSPVDFELLGGTIDDAAGEAFDKGGKLMGLGYPAGRIIDELAQKGNPKAHSFPIGLANTKDCRLSFSGVKTAIRQFLETNPDFDREQGMPDLCASYQHAIVEALKLKLKYAHEPYQSWPIVVGGGVACNSSLRQTLQKSFSKVHFVKPVYCTDNGAMIAHYALRTQSQLAISYPECLSLDAQGRYIEKDGFAQGKVASVKSEGAVE